jgi:hypothetical protein
MTWNLSAPDPVIPSTRCSFLPSLKFMEGHMVQMTQQYHQSDGVFRA